MIFTRGQILPILLYTYLKRSSHNKIKLHTLRKKIINTLYAHRNSLKLTNSHIIKGDKLILAVKI